MNDNPTRRSRLTGLAVREKSWDLENLKDQQRKANEQFENASQATQALADEIEHSQGKLSQAMNGEAALDLTTIQATGAYINGLHKQHRQNAAELRRAAQRASQADNQVKFAALAIRGLERVKTRTDKELDTIVQKRIAEQDIELWLQRAKSGEPK